MSDSESFIERLRSLIPGYGGYKTLESRREDDRLTREYLIRRLGECKRDLEVILKPAMEKMDFSAVEHGEKLRHAIEHEQNRIRSAVEGYASWFDKRNVDEDLLKKVSEMEESLIGVVDRMHRAIKPIDHSPPDWTAANSMLQLLNERFERRRNLLRESQ